MERGVENSQNSQNSPQRGKRRRMPQQNGTRDAELRAEIFRYSMEQASLAIRPQIEHLCRKWLEFNGTYFGDELIPPFLAFEEPGHTTCYGEYSTVSAFGGSGQIMIRPSLLAGTLQHFREGNRNKEGMRRFMDQVLLHEMIHQWQHEVNGTDPGEFNNYGGHGCTFSQKANEIGARLEIPPVRLRNKKSHSGKTADLPNPSQWPHCVTPIEHYLGAYVPASQDEDAILRRHLSVVLRRHGIEKVKRTADEVWKKIQEAREAKRRLAGATAKVINLNHKPHPDPDSFIYIGRRHPPRAPRGKEEFQASPWANYFSVKRYGRDGAIKRYVEKKLLGKPFLIEEELPKLAHEVLVEGKVLACWCAPNGPLSKDDPLYCHGQVLLRLLYSDEPHRDMLMRLVEKLS
jgi:hypothetical protein